MGKEVWLGIAIGVALLSGCSTSQPTSMELEPRVPSRPVAMPALDLVDTSGKRWDEQQFKGRTVLIEFWATWCAPCHEIAPDLSDFYARRQKDVDLISVSVDEERTAFSTYVESHKQPYPVLYGGSALVKPWSIRQLPTLILVRDGRILSSWEGKDTITDALRDMRL